MEISTGRICPRCGRSDIDFIGALCKECYVEVYGIAIIPDTVDFTYCRICGSYKYQGRWTEGLGDMGEVLREHIYIVLTQKVKPTSAIEDVWINDVELREAPRSGVVMAYARIAGRSGSLIVEDDRIVKAKVSITICPSCSRKLSKTGYNAIIQVRPLIGVFTEDLRREFEKVLEQLGGRVRDSIISIDIVKNGIDILVDDQNVARIIAGKLRSTFGGIIIETFKARGVKPQGGRKGVLTLSVRLLNIKPGSIIAYLGAPHIVIGGTPRGLRLYNIDRDEDVIVDYSFLTKAEVLNTSDYVSIAYKRLKLSRIEGENLIFMDLNKGREFSAKIGEVKVLRGNIVLGEVYMAYLIGGKLYILGGSV